MRAMRRVMPIIRVIVGTRLVTHYRSNKDSNGDSSALTYLGVSSCQ